MSEVLYWAEKLKGKWMEEMTGEGNGAHTLRQPEGGGEGCVSERCTEVEEKQTGEYPTAVLNSYKVWLNQMRTNIESRRASKK